MRDSNRRRAGDLIAVLFLLPFLAAPSVFAQKERVFTNDDIVSSKPAVTLRSYPLNGHGQFQLKVPPEWKDDLNKSPYGLPPTIVFSQKSGAPFNLMITPMLPPDNSAGLPPDDEVRRRVAQTAEHMKSQAVEKTIEIKQLTGPDARGYYYSATDRAPKPGEFKYMTQGILRVNELLVTFTVLTNDGQEQIAKDALAAMSSATQAQR